MADWNRVPSKRSIRAIIGTYTFFLGGGVLIIAMVYCAPTPYSIYQGLYIRAFHGSTGFLAVIVKCDPAPPKTYSNC